MENTSISHFSLFGISYKETPIENRGKVARVVSEFLLLAKETVFLHLRGIVVINTCNRTEFLILSSDIGKAKAEMLKISPELHIFFSEKFFFFKGKKAIEHIFSVACGKESQIPGDYHVLKQIKEAFQEAKTYKTWDTSLERLNNTIISCCKKIKSNTAFNDGSATFSYSAFQFLKKTLKKDEKKTLLMVGLGKTGKTTCQYIYDYFPNFLISVANRTDEKVINFKKENNVTQVLWGELKKEAKKFDCIICATNSDSYIFSEKDFSSENLQYVLDLSLPENVSPEVKNKKNIHYIDITTLSKQKSSTFEKRLGEIEKVNAIIYEALGEFTTWVEKRKISSLVVALKKSLTDIHIQELKRLNKDTSSVSPEYIEAVVNKIARKVAKNIQVNCNTEFQVEIFKQAFDLEMLSLPNE